MTSFPRPVRAPTRCAAVFCLFSFSAAGRIPAISVFLVEGGLVDRRNSSHGPVVKAFRFRRRSTRRSNLGIRYWPEGGWCGRGKPFRSVAPRGFGCWRMARHWFEAMSGFSFEDGALPPRALFASQGHMSIPSPRRLGLFRQPARRPEKDCRVKTSPRIRIATSVGGSGMIPRRGPLAGGSGFSRAVRAGETLHVQGDPSLREDRQAACLVRKPAATVLDILLLEIRRDVRRCGPGPRVSASEKDLNGSGLPSISSSVVRVADRFGLFAVGTCGGEAGRRAEVQAQLRGPSAVGPPIKKDSTKPGGGGSATPGRKIRVFVIVFLSYTGRFHRALFKQTSSATRCGL